MTFSPVVRVLNFDPFPSQTSQQPAPNPKPHRCGGVRSTGAAWAAAVEAIVLLQQLPSAQKAQLRKGGVVKKSSETP